VSSSMLWPTKKGYKRTPTKHKIAARISKNGKVERLRGRSLYGARSEKSPASYLGDKSFINSTPPIGTDKRRGLKSLRVAALQLSGEKWENLLSIGGGRPERDRISK